MDDRILSSPFRLARAAAWIGGKLSFTSRRRTARLLYGFARTEAQSRLELCRAAELCQSAERRSLYLRHALDEARHARALAEHASRLSLARGAHAFPSPAAPAEDLFERWGEARFLAFVQRGERRGRMQFAVYARLLRQSDAEPLAALFEALVRDERQHEAYCARLLREVAGEGGAEGALRWAARIEAWRAFRSRGRATAGLLYASVMLVLYALLTPYALAFRWLSRPRPGFSTKPEQ